MKLVCIGDSLTEGYQIDLLKRWTKALEEATGIAVINSGICGDTSAGMLARFKTMVIDHDPTHVLIMGGTNDMFAGIGLEHVKGNILAMTRYARHHGIIAWIGIPTPYHIDYLPRSEQTALERERAEHIAKMRLGLRAYFLEDGLVVIEMGEGLGEEDYLDDGLHPNEAGHQKMMENVRQAIERINHENTTHQ